MSTNSHVSTDVRAVTAVTFSRGGKLTMGLCNNRLPRASYSFSSLPYPRVEGSEHYFTWRTRAMRISCACTALSRPHKASTFAMRGVIGSSSLVAVLRKWRNLLSVLGASTRRREEKERDAGFSSSGRSAWESCSTQGFPRKATCRPCEAPKRAEVEQPTTSRHSIRDDCCGRMWWAGRRCRRT